MEIFEREPQAIRLRTKKTMLLAYYLLNKQKEIFIRICRSLSLFRGPRTLMAKNRLILGGKMGLFLKKKRLERV